MENLLIPVEIQLGRARGTKGKQFAQQPQIVYLESDEL